MKFAHRWTLIVILALCRALAAQSPADSDKVRLIGAWHLVSLGAPGENLGIKGSLIYTRDGHMSVQLMYPPSSEAITNDYVMNGYEASFGSYDVNEKTHTLTHHVQGSITRGLVGRDLPRIYELSGKRLVIKPANLTEHWSVTWEHD